MVDCDNWGKNETEVLTKYVAGVRAWMHGDGLYNM